MWLSAVSNGLASTSLVLRVSAHLLELGPPPLHDPSLYALLVVPDCEEHSYRYPPSAIEAYSSWSTPSTFSGLDA